MLAAQLAAMKAIEYRAADLESRNVVLKEESSVQKAQLHHLQQKVGGWWIQNGQAGCFTRNPGLTPAQHDVQLQKF